MARTKITASSNSEPPSDAHGLRFPGGSVFSDTLHSITKTKLNELAKKRSTYEDQKSSLLASAQLESNIRKRLSILVEGMKKCFPGLMDAIFTSKLQNMEQFLEQGRFDPSVTSEMMLEWEQSLIDHLNIHSSKFQYASLYGELVTEWLLEEKDESANQGAKGTTEPATSASPDDIKIEQKESYRSEWEENVFKPFLTDKDALENYLHNLFGKNVNREAFKAIAELRESVKSFESNHGGFRGGFSRITLDWTIGGLLSSKLLTDEKRAVLKGFRSNHIVLDEIADVLNMRLAALETWKWECCMTVDQRRHVNGKYEIFMHEDLLQAIFLQYIGVRWSVFFKSALTKFAETNGAWKSLRRPITKLEKRRREYYLGAQWMKDSVISKRQSLYYSHYFLSGLYSYEQEEIENVDGDEEVEIPNLKRQRVGRVSTGGKAPPGKQLASKAARKSAPSNTSIPLRAPTEDGSEYETEGYSSKPKNFMDLKQSLLHLISTDIIFNTQLQSEITILHSEFKSWNQSLPHSTISQILSYFGVSPQWVSFFHRFLEASLRFSDQPSSSSRTRQRGVPEDHVLSNVFSELVLFCLDYSINQSTNGQQLFRFQGDLWFWSPSQEACVNAWKSTSEFSAVMGINLDEVKSGSAQFHNQEMMSVEISPELPNGPIRWGFLVLKQDESGKGRFIIDQSIVSTQISSLKEHLFPTTGKRQSIFTWIKAWNTYASKFFSTNFGIPANCYGREHVDDILYTLQRMQSEIFVDHGGSVTSYLKAELQERFGITDIPDGFLYFATYLGGLELHSPFIPFLSIRDGLPTDPYTVIQDFHEKERENYEEAKDDFDHDRVDREGLIPEPHWIPENFKERDEFFSFEEYKDWREEFSWDLDGDLARKFEYLLERATERPLSDEMNIANDLDKSSVGTVTPYEKWVAQLYGPEMVKRFGRFNIADKSWLPVGMVSLFKDGRLKV